MSSVPAAPHPAPPELPERPAGASGPQPPPWRPWSAPVALGAGFGGAILAGLVLSIVAAIAGADLQHPPAWVGITATIVQDICLVASAVVAAALAAPPRPWQFGLRRPSRVWRSIGLAALAFVTFLLFSYAWLAAVGQTHAKDTITQDLGAGDSLVALLGVTFLVTVCAPLAEEFFFRGYYFGALRRLGLWPAALITGLTFGAVHVFGSPIAFLLPLAFLGTVLALLRERTRSLYPGMALHCINNTVALGSTQHWGWQTPVVLVVSLALVASAVWLALRLWPRGAATTAPATV